MSAVVIITGITFLAALGSGAIGGVFFAFSTFVMAALGRLPAGNGIAAMQSINVAVLNPWFLVPFFGTAALCLVLIVGAALRWQAPGAAWLVAGGALYLVGCFLVTILGNVPLNNALAGAVPDSAEGAALWARYLHTWTLWNHVRTAASLAAAAALVVGAIR